MDLPACRLLLRLMDELVHVALHRPIAARCIRLESAPRVHGEVRCLLHRLDAESTGRLDDAGPLATAPRNHRGPVLGIMAPAGLTLRAPATRSTPQRLLATPVRLPLVASGLGEVIRFHCAHPLTLGFIGQRRIAAPPTPAIAGADLEPSCPGNASRRTRQTHQAGGKHPGRQRPLALMEQRVGEVIEGALAAITPVAFASRTVVVGTPRSHILALAPGTLAGTLLPPQRMDISVTLSDVEEGMDLREHRHT